MKIDLEFMIMRYNMNESLIASGTLKFKQIYYSLLDKMLASEVSRSSALNSLLSHFNSYIDKNIDISKTYKLLKKVEHKKIGFLHYKKQNYKYLFIIELLYFKYLVTHKFDTQNLELYNRHLKFNKKEFQFLLNYLRLLTSFRFKDAEQILYNCGNKKIIASLSNFHNHVSKNYEYASLKKHNIVICATMSAGKSTFVNALLGNDYIPSKNQACTSKITSIADNDNISYIIGCKEFLDAPNSYCVDINQDLLCDWNNDNNINTIYLESNLEGIRSTDGVAVITDTPGTNYSGDITHADVTMNYLKNNSVELLIYIINATQTSTTDNQLLLQEIKSEVLDKKNSQILFLINKIDSFDVEANDDITSCIKGVENELIDLGYVNPTIIPISANAARLFKMVMKNDNLTKKEVSDFKYLFDLFYTDNFDLTQFTTYSNVECEHTLNEDEYEVTNMKIPHIQLQKALFNTAIPLVEKIIDNKINLEEK